MRVRYPVVYLVAFLACMGTANAWAETEVFALNSFFPWSVTSYPEHGSGDVVPLRTLQGSDTQLLSPVGMAVDSTHRELFVANLFPLGGVVAVYPLDATGNVAPIRIIANAGPTGLAVDSENDEIFVAQVGISAIAVYARTASGNVAPLRTISGASTGLTVPLGMWLDKLHDELAVADGDTIKIFARTASGNSPPLRTIVGPSTGLQSPRAITIDQVHNELFATNFSNNTITVYPRTATGDVSPLRTINLAGYSLGIVLDRNSDELLVSVDNEIVVYVRTATGSAGPLRTIGGSHTELFAPSALALATSVVSPSAKNIPALNGYPLGMLMAIVVLAAFLALRKSATNND